jgi:type I restriction enzyme S subunit
MRQLKEIAYYVSDKIDVKNMVVADYISTDNMLPEKGGITACLEKPEANRVTQYQAGDVLVSNIRPYFKKIWYSNRMGGCSNDVIVFRVIDETETSTRYLYYLLSQDHFFDFVMSGSNGTKMPRGNKKLIPEFTFKYVQIGKQEAIVDILSAYDDLTENNQKQIKLLEEAAMRLYKEWFVNLRFPGHESAKSIDGLPEGWRKATFSDLCQLVKDGCSSKDISKGTPYIGLEHIPRRSMCLNEWGNSSEVSSNKYRYKEYDVLFGKIRPYFHKVGFAINEGVCSTDAMVFRANENMFELLLTTAFSDEFVKHSYATCREGSKMPRADWNEMRIYPVLLPADDVLISFNNSIRRYVDLISIKYKQNHMLIKARDKLLPKLMSGEIEV